jgi:hypothetical protein
MAWSVSACNDYLDINTDPDYPSTVTATNEIRLPWIQYYYGYGKGTADMRISTLLGLLTQTSTVNNNGLLAAWNPIQGSSTTIYQNWYVGAAVNIDPMIAKAEELNEPQYAGAGYAIKALGFMMMLDLHGELPIEEMGIFKPNPKYDDGKRMYELCMGYLDKALEYFDMGEHGTPLARGDMWAGGNIEKWKKFCHGMKARYMLHLSKKAEGSDLFNFNMDGILAELDKALQSNSDNILQKHYNVKGDALNFTVQDPYQANYDWDAVAYGSSQRATRYYADLLNNTFTGGSGVVDPRMTKLLPAMMTNITLNENGGLKSFVWYRDIGVDMMNSDIRLNLGPVNSTFATTDTEVKYTIENEAERNNFAATAGKTHATKVEGKDVTVTYARGTAYADVTNYQRAGDTIYVNMRSNHQDTNGRSAIDLYYYPNTGANATDFVGGTGNFFARPTSDTYVMTYAEMCFIKAEVLFRKGDKGSALTAYQNGIKASFEQMQIKLNEWKAVGSVNPDEQPMNDADITAFMTSAAVVQDAGTLTMADIMRQKMIALGFDTENWVDIRRFNYSAGNVGSFGVVYPNYKRPKEFTATNKMIGSSPTDLTYWFRRFEQSSHESNYNLDQLKASNKQARENTIWSCPVWWDCATDDEYYGYIK